MDLGKVLSQSATVSFFRSMGIDKSIFWNQSGGNLGRGLFCSI